MHTHTHTQRKTHTHTFTHTHTKAHTYPSKHTQTYTHSELPLKNVVLKMEAKTSSYMYLSHRGRAPNGCVASISWQEEKSTP